MVDWYKEAKELNVTFMEHNKTCESNLKQIRQSIPRDLAAKLLPHTVNVDLVGFTQPVELVWFNLVEMILSMLQNKDVMNTEYLFVNDDDPFDNYHCGLDSR